MSAHTHAPIPVDFLPMISAAQISKEVRECADLARQARNRLSVVTQQMQRAPWLQNADTVADDLAFSVLPKLEEACAGIVDIEDRLS